MAEALLRHHLDALEIDIDVQSAGFTTTGRPVDRKATKALARHNIEPGDRTSRLATAELIDEALIVIGMTRKHVRDAVKLRSDASEKTFTLKELVTRGTAVGPFSDQDSVSDWIKRVDDGRNPADHLGAGADTDIDDPIGRSARFFQATADELDTQIQKLVPLWWPELQTPKS